MRAKITIFQTPVFQLFISLLYRTIKEHNASRPLRLCVRFFSHRIHGKHRTIRGVIISRRRRRLSQKHVAQILWISVSVCNFFCYSVRAAATYKKSKKVRFLTRLGGIWISRKYVVYLYREKEILPQRGYLLHFCPIFWVKKGKITRHMRKNMCRTI